MNSSTRIDEARDVLVALGFPRAQQNVRSALCLLALLNMTPAKTWGEAEDRLIGITPIMEWISENYQMSYAPNSRETIRKGTMHQFVSAGIVLYNPDKPDRPVNSPKAVYQIEQKALALLRTFGAEDWCDGLTNYAAEHETLVQRYASERNRNHILVKIAHHGEVALSRGEHSELIRSIIEEFGPRFTRGGVLIYAGDTGDKWGYFDAVLLAHLGVVVDPHGKMPDVVIFDPVQRWLLLVEAVTSTGPVDNMRHTELARLFARSTVSLVYVTAFASRSVMARYLGEIAWATEAWVADAPSHLIHFNGDRFLGPHGTPADQSRR
jgi:hypothetical protein